MTQDVPENLTIPETVQRFRIGRTRLYHLISAGDIIAYKLGARTLVHTESVRNYIAKLPLVGD